MGRSQSKKEQEIWKAVAKDMKGKKINPRTGQVVRTRQPPKPPAPKPPKPRNKRTGPDYLDR